MQGADLMTYLLMDPVRETNPLVSEYPLAAVTAKLILMTALTVGWLQRVPYWGTVVFIALVAGIIGTASNL